MVFLAVFAIGDLAYVRISRITLEKSIDRLANETQLTSLHFKAAYDEMNNDAFVVARTPPVMGIVRASRNQGVDQLDGSTTELLRKRMEAVFTSVMTARLHYTQMRFIGVADNGRELVRVDRRDGALNAVPRDELQEKGGEPYYKASLGLREDEVYFSDVTYNREHGNIDAELIPTVRTIAPVFNEMQELVGFIVINADYPKLITKTFMKVLPSIDTVIVNHAGDYMEYSHNGTISDFVFHADIRHQPPPFIEKISATSSDGESFMEQDTVAYFVRLSLDARNPNTFLGVMLKMPRDELLRDAQSIRFDIQVLAIELILLSLLITFLASRALTKPLIKMTKNIVESKDFRRELDLPTGLNDEIGDLARAFQVMADELMSSENRYEVAVRGSNCGIWDWDIATNEVYWSERFDEMIGNAGEEQPSFDEFENRLHPDDHDRVIQAIDDHLRLHEPYDNEFKLRHSDGHYFWVLARGQAIWDDRGQPIRMAGSIDDISEAKANEAERDLLIAKLARSNEELDNFAYIASHDLKEPLRAIHNHCRFLLEDCEDVLDQSGVKRLHRLMDLARRMEKLISDLLYFSRLGRTELARKETDVNCVIDEITCTLHDTMHEENASIVVPEPLPTIVCDSVRVTEMFRNLVCNAIKYNDRDRKIVEIGCNLNGANVFYVKDNGIGIEEEFHCDVFRIFKRLHSEKKYGEGTGSGLTFVKKIVEQHGGKIWIESTKGEGSTFYFTLDEGVVA